MDISFGQYNWINNQLYFKVNCKILSTRISPGLSTVNTNTICANPFPEKLSLNAELTFSDKDFEELFPCVFLFEVDSLL